MGIERCDETFVLLLPEKIYCVHWISTGDAGPLQSGETASGLEQRLSKEVCSSAGEETC